MPLICMDKEDVQLRKKVNSRTESCFVLRWPVVSRLLFSSFVSLFNGSPLHPNDIYCPKHQQHSLTGHTTISLQTHPHSRQGNKSLAMFILQNSGFCSLFLISPLFFFCLHSFSQLTVALQSSPSPPLLIPSLRSCVPLDCAIIHLP